MNEKVAQKKKAVLDRNAVIESHRASIREKDSLVTRLTSELQMYRTFRQNFTDLTEKLPPNSPEGPPGTPTR